MTKDDTTKDHASKRAALALLSEGLVTRSEASRLAGVSRQLVRHWARDIPVDRNRAAVLAKLWAQFLARKSPK